MSSVPVIVSLLGKRVKDWQRYEDYVTMKLEDSPLDLLLFNTAPVEFTLGEVNWVLIGVKKGYGRELRGELVWRGYLRRKAEFVGEGVEVLNKNQQLLELIQLVEPVGMEVRTNDNEGETDLNVSISLLYVPSPGFNTVLQGAVKAVEIATESLAEPTTVRSKETIP